MPSALELQIKAKLEAVKVRDRYRDALTSIMRNAESQLIALDAINAPDDDPARINARWNYIEANSALTGA